MNLQCGWGYNSVGKQSQKQKDKALGSTPSIVKPKLKTKPHKGSSPAVGKVYLRKITKLFRGYNWSDHFSNPDFCHQPFLLYFVYHCLHTYNNFSINTIHLCLAHSQLHLYIVPPDKTF